MFSPLSDWLRAPFVSVWKAIKHLDMSMRKWAKVATHECFCLSCKQHEKQQQDEEEVCAARLLCSLVDPVEAFSPDICRLGFLICIINDDSGPNKSKDS